MTPKSEKTLNICLNVFILAGMLAVVLYTNIRNLQEEDGRMAMSIIAGVGALMGVINAILSANGNIWTYLFGIIDVSITALVAYDNEAWGNYGLHIFFFLPMQLAGLFIWLKRLHTGEDGKKKRQVISRRLPAKGWAIASASFLVITVVLYLFLSRMDRTPAIAALDSAIFAMNIVGQVLMSMAYTDQWFFWIAVDVCSVVMWALTSVSSAESGYVVIYVAKYFFYTLNAVNGLRIWLKLSH
jgi:nicotinamide mononucleotide transporter